MNDENIKRREAKITFALTVEGVLVDISHAQRNQPYTCPGCSDSVIPVMGDKNAWHYRHVTVACPYESYLHKTAKRAFYDRARTSTELALILERIVTCSSDKLRHFFPEKPACKAPVAAKYNLSRLFDDVHLEKRDGDTGLTPDVFLRNTQSGAKCYVEIHVTNPCSDEKIKCGIPIIEIAVSSEDDIHRIRSESIDIRQSNVTVYNFYPERREANTCSIQCQYADIIFRSWGVNSRGHLHAKEVSFSDIELSTLAETQTWPADISPEIEMKCLREFLKSQPASDYNCLLCKSAVDWNNGFISCSVKKRTVPYDEANQCAYLEVEE